VDTFSLESSENGFDHSSANSLSLAAPHQIYVEMRGVVTLKLSRKEKLNIMEISNQILVYQM
jgi:hypothetical protein